MKKPITLVMEETTNNLVQILNCSDLPLFIITQILKDLYTESSTLSRQQAEKDKNEYYNSLQSENMEQHTEDYQSETVTEQSE